MDFKKFLKPLAGIALSVAAFASCAVGVKNPVLVDAFEYSTSDPSSGYTFSGDYDASASPFNVVDVYEDEKDGCYLGLQSKLPSSFTALHGKINARDTTLQTASLSSTTFDLYTGASLGTLQLPFVSLDIKASSGGYRDVFSLVAVSGGTMEIIYCSDPESWKIEYGAAAVYQWENNQNPTIYLIRAKDFVSYQSILQRLSFEAGWVAPDGNNYYLYGSYDWYPDYSTLGENGYSLGVRFDYPYMTFENVPFGGPFTFNYRTLLGRQVYQFGYSEENLFTQSYIGVYGIRENGNSGPLLGSNTVTDPAGGSFVVYQENAVGYVGFRFVCYADPYNLDALYNGYAYGYEDGYADGKDYGYNSGYDVGYSAGNGEGFSSGFSAGYADGYGNGFHDGDISAQGISWNFFSMLSMVFSAPFTIIVNSFDFTFFEGTPNAFNFGTFFWGMFSLLLAFAIFKVIWGFIAGGK